MGEIAQRYRRRAEQFEQKVAAVRPEQWGNQSPCEKWSARDVVDHVVMMHGHLVMQAGRTLEPADDPLTAFRQARAAVEAVLADPALAEQPCETPVGPMTVEQHIDQVVSDDLVLHGWDLARATGQDDTMDPVDVERLWASIAADTMEKFRTPDAFGPGIEVFGAEVPVPEDASLQDRLLGLIGRQP
jgi:uncharacterized protein (TIGR03086 family)